MADDYLHRFCDLCLAAIAGYEVKIANADYISGSLNADMEADSGMSRTVVPITFLTKMKT